MTLGPERWGRLQGQDPIAPAGATGGPTSAVTPIRPDTSIIRPMPSSTAGPSFQALAMKSVLSRARDTSRFEAPEAGDRFGHGQRRPPLRLLLVLAVVTVLLGVLGGTVWVALHRDPGIDDQTIVRVSQSPGAKIRSPQETVRGYLKALAVGDIDEALQFGPSVGTGSDALLTPAAQANMPAGSRPSDITIITQDAVVNEVAVSYTLAGKPVSTTMRVTRDDAGSYSLEQTTIDIQLQVVGGDNLPTHVNGIEVDNRLALKVVPGTYAPSTGLPFLEFPEGSSLITISSLSYNDITLSVVNPELTVAGRTALMDAARASLERCIASKELTPTGCPNARRPPADKAVVPGSVVWTLVNRSTVWKDITATLSPADQTVAVGTVALNLSVTMGFTDGSTAGRNDELRTVGFRAIMLGRDPGRVDVIWER